MTLQEAVETLKSNRPSSDPRKCGVELCTAVDIAIDCIKKQIPYKPSTDGLKVGVGRCKCRVEFLDKTTKCCGNCGQRLDWSGHK